MQSNDNKLLAAYKRRAFLPPGLLTMLAAGMALAPLASLGQDKTAQDPPKPAVQTTPVPGTAQTTPVPGTTQTGVPPAGGAQVDPNVRQGDPTTIIPRQRRPFTINPDGTQGRDPNQGRGGRSGGFGGFPGGTPVSFDFRGSNIIDVLRFFSQMSGQTITADAALSGQVTIINPKPVQLDDAFKILQSVLAARGFTAVTNGSVISIVPFNTGVRTSSHINTDKDVNKSDPRNEVMTQIIPLDNVEADALAKDLNPLISTGASLIGSNSSNALILTDTADNIKRFLTIVESLDKSSANNEMVIYPLRRAEASNVAGVITSIYSQTTTRNTGAGGGGRNGQPQMNVPGQPQGQQAATAAARPTVVAIADTRTNSVIVIASREKQTEIAKKLIATLDDDDSNTLDTKFVKIKYADATTVASLVNNVLSNMHGTASSGGGNGSFQSRIFGFDPFGLGNGNQSGGSSSDPFGKVVAEPRTNSLLVTANAEKMAKIEELIKQMDVAVPTETTTFVIKLKNANATDVSTALSQAFGTTQNGQNNNNNGGGNRTATGTNAGNGTQRSNTNRAFGGSATPPGRQAAPTPPPGPQSSQGAQDDGSAIPQGVEGVMTSNGFVPASNSNQNGPTRQFGGGFGGFFGGGGQNRGRQGSTLGSSTSPQFGRGSNGSYVNLLQLQGNVFTTPTPNGDSIIVTTTPDNIEAVKNIVEQLDIVPRQVMIEVVVAEVTLSSDQKLGFSAAGMLNRLFHSATTGGLQANQPVSGFVPTTATALDAAARGFQFVLNNANYSAVLQALDDSTNVNILATPKVFTSNNQQATINIQQFVPYITGQASSGLAGTTVANQVQYLQVGFSLVVTPRITRDGQVTMDLIQEASELLNYQTLGTGQGAIQAPVTNDRYTDTEVTVQDNETIVIGGLIRQSNNVNRVKVPLLGDIPLIGQLFQSKQRSHEKQELVIFVTPHVVNNSDEARALAKKSSESISRQIPELGKQQPNLDYFKKKPATRTAPGKKSDESTMSPTGDKTTDTTGVPASQNPNIRP